MALKITSAVLEQIRNHGEETYPFECCGVLLGEFDEAGDKSVASIVACENTRVDSPENRYHISPAELVRIQREAALSGTDIVGFYHSHPDHPAHWSATDLAEAHWTGCSYVITGIEKGRATTTSFFMLEGHEESKRFEEEAFEITA
jgi:proteasome lid subunit RPN8/RPN11